MGLLLLTLLTALPPLLAVPLAAKPDETYHWAYATHLARTGRLPPFLSADDATSRESHQPPLYYWLASQLTRRFAVPDAFADRLANPFIMATERGNRNAIILGPDARQSFWIGRGLSLALWLFVPLAVLWTWRPFLGLRGGLTAAAVIVLIPLLAFLGTSYSNDMANLAFTAAALGALLRLVDPERPPQWRWCLLLGLSLGLATLSKLYALPLLGAILLLALAPVLEMERGRRFRLLAALGVAGLMLIPWMLDACQRFGDPLGMSVFGHIMGEDPAWLRHSKILQVSVQAWRTFWGDVGPGGVDAVPVWLAVGLAVVEVAALAGAVRGWRRSRQSRLYRTIGLLLGGWVLLALVSFVLTFLRAGVTVIAGGRNLLYLHLVNAPLLVVGLREWARCLGDRDLGAHKGRRCIERAGRRWDRDSRAERAVRAILVTAGLVLTVWAWTRMAVIYPIPQRTTLSTQPAAPLAAFGAQYALLDWRAQTSRGGIEVEFSLAKTGADDRPRAYFIQVVTPDGRLLANINTYPAYGALSTSHLPPGAVLHESYLLRLAEPAPPGSRLLLGLWAPPATDQRLPAFDAAGHPLPDSAYAAPWPSS